MTFENITISQRGREAISVWLGIKADARTVFLPALLPNRQISRSHGSFISAWEGCFLTDCSLFVLKGSGRLAAQIAAESFVARQFGSESSLHIWNVSIKATSQWFYVGKTWGKTEQRCLILSAYQYDIISSTSIAFTSLKDSNFPKCAHIIHKTQTEKSTYEKCYDSYSKLFRFLKVNFSYISQYQYRELRVMISVFWILVKKKKPTSKVPSNSLLHPYIFCVKAWLQIK